MDPAILSFSFLNGVFAFFAPCAVALLPGYIARLLGLSESKKGSFARALIYAGLTIAGIVVIYALASVLILSFSALLKSYLVYISMALGVLLIVLGIVMAMGKDISFSFHPKLKSKNNFVEAFLFGIVYGLAALGCLFPLFLSVAFFAFNAPTFLIGGIYLLVYMVGMSMFMLAFYIVTTFAKQWLQRSLSKILPYVMRVSGGLVAIAGVYMIWYNWALL